MFANRARSQHFNHGPRHNRAVVRPNNDNQRQLRTVAAPRRQMRRPVLGSRWLVGPSGALECAWHVEASEITDEPVSSWGLRQTRALSAVTLRSRSPWHRGRRNTCEINDAADNPDEQ
jgi:hypothetical protein